jgi:cyclophilin family peptidyl-prolyl cis-trans isomerase
MLQGGGYNAQMGEKHTASIKGEFAANGYMNNTLTHERGVISMARSNDNDSASCQFFIMHKDDHYLDGKYAAFGRVVAGIETVDTIAELEVTEQKISKEPTRPVRVPVIESAYFVNFTPEAPTT